MTGAPGRAWAGADRSRRVDDAGEHGRRDAETLEERLVPRDGGGVDQRGDGGVGGVRDVERVPGPPPRRPRGSRPPRCRPCRSRAPRPQARARSGSTASRMAMSLVADALGARRMPWACSSRQVPTVRRSCHPMPGASGFARGPVPHDARGPLVGDADRVDRPTLGERGPGHRQGGVGHDARRRIPPGPAQGSRAGRGRGGRGPPWRRAARWRRAHPRCRRRRPGRCRPPCSCPG